LDLARGQPMPGFLDGSASMFEIETASFSPTLLGGLSGSKEFLTATI
jgi:hypothetical protein